MFRCTAFVHQNQPNQSKLDPKASRCVFVGYYPTQQGYKCYDPTNRKFIVSCDVSFFKHQPFFKHHQPQESTNNPEDIWSTLLPISGHPYPNPLCDPSQNPENSQDDPNLKTDSINPISDHPRGEGENVETCREDQAKNKSPLQIYSRRPQNPQPTY